MKKYMFKHLTGLLIAFIVSCTSSFHNHSEDIIGEWKFISIENTPKNEDGKLAIEGFNMLISIGDTRIIYRKSGIAEKYDKGVLTISYQYELSGDTIYMIFMGIKEPYNRIVSITDSELLLEDLNSKPFIYKMKRVE